MGTDGLIGRPKIRQPAYWRGALVSVAAFLTGPRAPGSAVCDPMLMNPARASPAAAVDGGNRIGGATGDEEFRKK